MAGDSDLCLLDFGDGDLWCFLCFGDADFWRREEDDLWRFGEGDTCRSGETDSPLPLDKDDSLCRLGDPLGKGDSL